MIPIETYEDLPQPVRAMAKNFYEADINQPEVYEVTSEEYDNLAVTDDVVTQLLFWRREHKYYAVVAGDAQRKIKYNKIIHDPYFKPCSILAFYEIDEHMIPLWNNKYSNKSLSKHALEMNV